MLATRRPMGPREWTTINITSSSSTTIRPPSTITITSCSSSSILRTEEEGLAGEALCPRRPLRRLLGPSSSSHWVPPSTASSSHSPNHAGAVHPRVVVVLLLPP